MLMIDIFDKSMHVEAIKSKKEEVLASGMIECLNKMGKKPKIMYTDDEGAMNQEAIQKYLQEQNIEHHRTRAVMFQIFGLFFVVFVFLLFIA